MADIQLSFPIFRDAPTVYAAMTEPAGLDAWWTHDSQGVPAMGAPYQFGFGPDVRWTGNVTQCDAPQRFEWTMRDADADWQGTRVGFALTPFDGGVQVEFHHRGWPEENAHFRISCYCWATYLRILKRHLEHGEQVAYDARDNA